LAREVDEELFASLVLLAHRDVEVAPPAPVELGELAVGVAVGVGLFVLVPQEHERHALLRQFRSDVGEVGKRARLRVRLSGAEQARLEGLVVEILG
jgi:hypothetical protein